MKMISMSTSPEAENTKDSPRSTSSSMMTSTPTFGRKSRSRKKLRRDKSLDRVSIQSNRSTSLTRHSIRSVSAIFPKSWKDSFRKKEEGSPSMQRKELRSELSTEECAPGVLKVFGNSVTPGAEYKSVLATQSSTSQELIKEALERYGISRKYAPNFVLCDVIGHIGVNGEEESELNCQSDDPVWTEQCVRVIGDYERPLTLQMYWKPVEGYSRRFEIRKRCEIQTHEDTITSGINANARRMLLAKIKPTTLSTDNLYYQLKGDEADDEADLKAASGLENRTGEIDLLSNVTHRSGNCHTCGRTCSGSGELSTMDSIPKNTPYLLTIKHFNESDVLVHKLAGEEVTIGSNNLCSVTLFAPDVTRRHCLICKKDGHSCRNGQTEGNSRFSIRPEGKESVFVNSKRISNETALHSYDLISVGDNYTFMFKNPCEESQGFNENTLAECVNSKIMNSSQTENGNRYNEEVRKETNVENNVNSDLMNNNKPNNLKNVENAQSVRKDSKSSTTESVRESKEVIQWRLRRNVEYERDSTRLKIRFQKEQIDNLLDTIINLGNSNPNMYKLSPSYLLCMSVEYSAVKFEQCATRRLLLKMVNLIQNEVWGKAKILAEKQTNLQHTNIYNTLSESLNDIQPLVLWMANSLEILHFFQQNLQADFLLDPAVSLPAGSRQSLLGAQEEVLAVLEEVVMYTFQQTVYYVTKTLYSLLPAMLNTNPFTEQPSDSDSGTSGMDDVISVFQIALETFTENQLHPQIMSQLFCYLFYFTSTTVFNSMMAKGAGAKYFKWQTGVQLRGNLDLLQGWTTGNGLREEANMYLKKLDCIANLLTIPKVQLTKLKWIQLSRDFSDLSPIQLNHVLSNYQLGASTRIPFDWNPPHDTWSLGEEEECLAESFTKHPPLVLPGEGFSLSLSEGVPDSFYVTLKEIMGAFGTEDDNDSGLSCSQSLTMNNLSLDTNLCDSMGKLSCKEPLDTMSFDSVEFDSLPCTPEDIKTNSSSQFSYPTENRRMSNGLNNFEANGGMSERVSVYDSLYSKRRGILPRSKLNTENKARTSPRNAASKAGLKFDLNPKDDVEEQLYVNLPVRKDPFSTEPDDKWYESESPPLAASTPYSSDNSPTNRSPTSGVSGGAIPPQPKIPAPTLNRQTSTGSLNRQMSSESLKSISRSDSLTNKHQPNGHSIEDNSMPIAPSRNRSARKKKSMDPDSIETPPRVPPLNLSLLEVPHRRESETGNVSPCGSMTNYFVMEEKSPAPKPAAKAPPKRMWSFENGEEHGISLMKILQARGVCRMEEELSDEEEIFTVELRKGGRGLGLGLIDGLYTPLQEPGIYVRTLVPGEPAARDGSLKLGDKILAVNGESIVGSSYHSAMDLIRNGGEKLLFLVAKSTMETSTKITSSTC